MITYEIRRLNELNNSLNIRYTNSNEELPEFHCMATLPLNFTEEQVHAVCVEYAEDAALFWQGWQDTEKFTLEKTSGTIKDIQVEDSPEFNALYERIEPSWTEDNDTKFKSWVKVPYSAEEKARNIRHRRDQQLAVTDMEAVSDRNISQEMLDYRQALRDITDQETFPNSVIWPIKPIG